MERNIVSAAKWLGASMVLSSIVLAVGFHLSLSANAEYVALKMSRSVEKAGSNARTSGITVQPAFQFQQGTPFKVGIQQLTPIKVEIIEKSNK